MNLAITGAVTAHQFCPADYYVTSVVPVAATFRSVRAQSSTGEELTNDRASADGHRLVFHKEPRGNLVHEVLAHDLVSFRVRVQVVG